MLSGVTVTDSRMSAHVSVSPKTTSPRRTGGASDGSQRRSQDGEGEANAHPPRKRPPASRVEEQRRATAVRCRASCERPARARGWPGRSQPLATTALAATIGPMSNDKDSSRRRPLSRTAPTKASAASGTSIGGDSATITASTSTATAAARPDVTDDACSRRSALCSALWLATTPCRPTPSARATAIAASGSSTCTSTVVQRPWAVAATVTGLRA